MTCSQKPRPQPWNLLEKGVKLSLYRKKQANIASYVLVDGDLVDCKDVCGLMEELQLQHAPDQWRLFIDSSKLSLKAVLLHNGNKLPSIFLAHAVHMKETHASIYSLYVTKTTSGTYSICRPASCGIADWAARRLYEMLLLPV
jgi:hypothetical protein